AARRPPSPATIRRGATRGAAPAACHRTPGSRPAPLHLRRAARPRSRPAGRRGRHRRRRRPPSRAASRPRRGAPWAMVRTSRPTPEPRAPDAHPVLDPGRAGAHRADVVHPYAALQAVADAAVEAPRRACALVVTQHPFARGEECGGDALALEGDELPAFEAEAHLAAAQC